MLFSYSCCNALWKVSAIVRVRANMGPYLATAYASVQPLPPAARIGRRPLHPMMPSSTTPSGGCQSCRDGRRSSHLDATFLSSTCRSMVASEMLAEPKGKASSPWRTSRETMRHLEAQPRRAPRHRRRWEAAPSACPAPRWRWGVGARASARRRSWRARWRRLRWSKGK